MSRTIRIVMIRMLMRIPKGSVAKFDFWGKIQKLGIRNSMTYRLPKSRKSNFATELPEVLLHAYHRASVSISAASTDVHPCFIPFHQHTRAIQRGNSLRVRWV